MARVAVVIAGMLLACAVSAHADASVLSMHVSVHPDPLRSTTRSAYVEVITEPRIVCVAFVLYDNGLLPLSFQHARTAVTSYRGVATWSWSDPPRATGGTASVSCDGRSATRTVNVHFRVLQDGSSSTRPRVRPPAPFQVSAAVSPEPLRRTSYFATLTAHTSARARCVAGVYYDDGAVAQSFAGYPQIAIHGIATWHWHVATATSGGTATVTCTFQGKTLAATVLFTIRRP